jgi:hypothetical protein
MAEMVDRDVEHLRLLTIGYNVLAGMTAFFSLFALLYVGFGVFMASGVFPVNQTANNDPRPIGYILIAIGAAVFIFGMAVAALYFAVGRSLRNRHRRIFCLAMAGLSCVYIPWGTAIGVCTIIVLNRAEVKRLFEPNQIALDGSASPP